MKGIILAGGTGSRLLPLTKVVNKHLLPVYDKPMIYYPLATLKKSGVNDILIIVGGNSVGDFVNLLGDGEEFDVSITYKHQSKPDGIAGALKLARNFIANDDCAVILGDNIFKSHIHDLPKKFSESKVGNKPTGMIFISPTNKPQSFGVPTFDGDRIIKITEKPKKPDSNFAVTGLYVYDKYIWDMIDGLKPSDRGEFEITDVNNYYLNNGVLKHEVVKGFWHDAGSIESLLKVSMLVAGK